MKPQLDHPMIAHKAKKEEFAPELPVHTVMPAGDEEAFVRQMQQNEAVFTSTKTPEPDGILDREMKKRDVFNKLVLLKEDHYTEVSIAGLTWKIKILNSIDNNTIMKELRKEAPDDQLATLPLLVLAAAVIEVNGIRFDDFYSGPSNIQDSIMKRYYELRQWQRPIINLLQKAYNEFQASVEKDYGKDFLVK